MISGRYFSGVLGDLKGSIWSSREESSASLPCGIFPFFGNLYINTQRPDGLHGIFSLPCLSIFDSFPFFYLGVVDLRREARMSGDFFG